MKIDGRAVKQVGFHPTNQCASNRFTFSAVTRQVSQNPNGFHGFSAVLLRQLIQYQAAIAMKPRCSTGRAYSPLGNNDRQSGQGSTPYYYRPAPTDLPCGARAFIQQILSLIRIKDENDLKVMKLGKIRLTGFLLV